MSLLRVNNTTRITAISRRMHNNAIEAHAITPPIRGPLETVENTWSAAVTSKQKYYNKLT